MNSNSGESTSSGSTGGSTWDSTLARSLLHRQCLKAMHSYSDQQLESAASNCEVDPTHLALYHVAQSYQYWRGHHPTQRRRILSNLRVLSGTNGPILTTQDLIPTLNEVESDTSHDSNDRDCESDGIDRWSTIEKRAFLHSSQRIGLLYQLLLSERALTGPSLQSLNDDDIRCLYRPVPFLIRWPIATRHRSDIQQFDGNSSSSTSDSESSGPVRIHHPISVKQLLDGSWRSDPSRPNFAWIRTNSSKPLPLNCNPFDELSSIVKGCPWFLQCDHHLDSSEDACLQQVAEERIVKEQLVIANSISIQLGLDDNILKDTNNGVHVRDGHVGKRKSCPSDDLHLGKLSCRHPWNHFFNSLPSHSDHDSSHLALSPHSPHPFDTHRLPLSSQCHHAFHRVFESSVFIGVARFHLRPWPLLLVGPIAPGFVGGLIMGENVRD